MSIMAKYAATGKRFINMKCLVLIGLSTLWLGYGIRLVTLRGLRWWTLVSLVTLRGLVPVTHPLILSLGVGGIDSTLSRI